jgi:hypothetical protein
MWRQIAGPVALVVVGIAVLIAGHGSTAGQAVAFALIGVACVIALSLVFLAVGRSEDAERAASAPPPPPPAEPSGPPAHEEARRRRRPMPPRRPS